MAEELWYKDNCPSCRIANWCLIPSGSNESDLDIHGIKCRKCGHEWLIYGLEDICENIVETPNIVSGQGSPK